MQNNDLQKDNLQFLGLGKTKFNSSICLIDQSSTELILTERLNRKKNSGLWPELPLKSVYSRLNIQTLKMAENRDVHRPSTIEDIQNTLFPFYDYLQKNELGVFTKHFNPDLPYISHHLCHAHAALALSPFEKSVIVVMDGAGTEVNKGEFEECTIYLQNGVKLTQVTQQLVRFATSTKNPTRTFTNRIGGSYETASEFIFNSPHSSGKVMGLASFGTPMDYSEHLEFQENLGWDHSFKGKSKNEWENLDHTLFKNIAASVQQKLESDYDKIIQLIKMKYPDYENLILTGGCALNCTHNAKLLYQKLFSKIFVPPFPGDECIGFGLAHYLKYQNNPGSWMPVPFENQSAYFGSMKSIPLDEAIEKEFSRDEFEIKKCNDIIDETAELLKEKYIVAWFQGRSESGPRALGNRSILARPDVIGLKDKLNKNIKFRESFRPYGCSVIQEKAHLYFDIDQNFNNPYMSFAIKVREEHKELLKEVSHIDGTSRMQTVKIGQNEKFYKLLERFGEKSGVPCLLNTSLNVMDEPIVETIQDVRRFMENTPTDYLVINDFLIKRKDLRK